MLKKGLKCGIDSKQFYERLSKNPDVLEFYLREEDLFGTNLTLLKNRIQEAKIKGSKVYLHQPMHVHSNWLHMLLKDCMEEDYLKFSTRVLVDLCREFEIKCVIHFSYGCSNTKSYVEPFFSKEEDYDLFINVVNSFFDVFDKERKYILVENCTDGASAFRYDSLLVKKLKGSNIPICLDISHLAISLNSFENSHVYSRIDFDKMNECIHYVLSELKDEIKYFHVVDTDAIYGIHDSLPLGVGKVDWSNIVDLIIEKDYIYEIDLKNHNDCSEMLESHRILSSI